MSAPKKWLPVGPALPAMRRALPQPQVQSWNRYRAKTSVPGPGIIQPPGPGDLTVLHHVHGFALNVGRCPDRPRSTVHTWPSFFAARPISLKTVAWFPHVADAPLRSARRAHLEDSVRFASWLRVLSIPSFLGCEQMGVNAFAVAAASSRRRAAGAMLAESSLRSPKFGPKTILRADG